MVILTIGYGQTTEKILSAHSNYICIFVLSLQLKGYFL